MKPENNLLQQLQTDDPAVLEVLMTRFTPYVFAVLRRRLGSFATAEDVEELASNVFFALWQHRKRLKTANLRAWLAKVASNEAAGWLRRQRISTVCADDWVTLPDETAALLEDAAARRLLAEQALLLLDEQTREIFQRCYTERQTVAEIARVMGLRVPTVKSRLQRGRKKLKEELEKGGVSLEDELL